MDVTVLVAVVAVIVSIVTAIATIIQARKTAEALELQQRFSRANTVLHFTQSFFHLIEANGRPTQEKLEDQEWTYKYWGLHSTEFYFYHHAVIPKLMYALWMVDIADLYAQYPLAWNSHENFLDFYAVLYPEMKDFFSSINDLSKVQSRDTRHREVKKFVLKWIKDNPGKDIE